MAYKKYSNSSNPMGTILPVAGAVVGGVYGGPVGAAVGGQLGSTLGGATKSGQDQTGGLGGQLGGMMGGGGQSPIPGLGGSDGSKALSASNGGVQGAQLPAMGGKSEGKVLNYNGTGFSQPQAPGDNTAMGRRMMAMQNDRLPVLRESLQAAQQLPDEQRKSVMQPLLASYWQEAKTQGVDPYASLTGGQYVG